MATDRDLEVNHREASCAPVKLLPGRSASAFDEVAATRAAAALLRSLGMDMSGEHREGTPRRMVLALREMLTARPFGPTSFENSDGYSDLVTLRAVPFFSLCEHHVLPFIGTATVSYLPGERIIGLSKLARVVEMFARRLQVQERMTVEIADWLVRTLEPRGVGVHLQAEHLCMALRGARVRGVLTVTTARRGAIDGDRQWRREWERLLPSPADWA